ncbi:MAG: signal recognition particle-docking protein FtsY [Campylobacterales bacterium]
MFSFLKNALNKTTEAIKSVIPTRAERQPKEVIEEALIEADVGFDTIEKILKPLGNKITETELTSALRACFDTPPLPPCDASPCVTLIIGVNGAGKTTTIAKLAKRYQEAGESVLLGAGDTFRAAAVEQLKRWGERLGVEVISTKQGGDPSALAFDTISAARARGVRHVIIDTAGRLHTQHNLAEELKKIVRVCDKALPGSPHRKILVLDGTQGNSAINQARAFHEMVGIDGLIVTKLDGTAKGGALLSIADELKLPILDLGIGEGANDLHPFNTDDYIQTLIDSLYGQS